MQASPFDDARLDWRKASRSTGSGNDCVEVAHIPGLIGVRDSKTRDAHGRNVSPVIEITAATWRHLSNQIKSQSATAQF